MKKHTESTVTGKSKQLSTITRMGCAVISGFLILAGLACQPVAAQSAEAMQEAEEYFKGLSGDFSAVNDRIDQATGAYEKFSECVKGSGDVGKECQQYIDLLYNTAGIEVQDQVMEGKQMMEEMLKQFEESGVYEQLVSAKKIFSAVGTAMSDAQTALEFANKFNPEGARGDPTRGLNLIGEAIGGAADKLPYPMNEIFKGYSEAVTGISKQLVQLQSNLENARQGNLGGGYAMFAEAQAYFETRFTGPGGRDTDLFFDVTSQFPLLGRGVQVFQDLINNEGSYYIYEGASEEIGETGWLAPSSFATVYQYFSALPNLSVLPPAFRVQRLVAQATTNSESRIGMAIKHRQDFLNVKNSVNTERLLDELGLLTSLNNLLTNAENAFVGLWLFVDETRTEIQKIADALAFYVYVEGTVTRIEDTGAASPAANVQVMLNVDGGGLGSAATDEQGAYFVYARGEPQLTFSLRAGAGDDTVRLSSRFLSRGFDDVNLVLENKGKSPVSISVSPDNAILQQGQTVTFRALAIFEDGSSLDITNLPMTTWSPGANFTATEETEPGEHTISATYMNMTGTAVVTIPDREDTNECGENGTWDEALNKCVCNEGYEWIDELGTCASLGEAIDEMTDEPEDALCDEKLMAAKLARLRQIIAESRSISSRLMNLTDQFMKVVNDKSANPCYNQIVATAYAGALQLSAELQAYEIEATEISSELILEAAICGTADPDYSIASILNVTGQLGSPLEMADQGIALMESELMTFGCDNQEVADRGDQIADVTADPEVISGLGTQDPGINPPGPSTGGTTGSVAVVYDGMDAPLNSLNISINFGFSSYSFFLTRDGQDVRYFQNAQLGAGDVMQISVPGASLNASITLLSSDFIWIDPQTNQQTSPGEGFAFFTAIVGVYFDDDEDVNRYRMIVGIGTLGMGIPGFPDGSGRELNY